MSYNLPENGYIFCHLLWGYKEMLEIREGVLMYSWLGERKWILVAPKGLRQRILEHCHAKGVGGHFGIDKTRLKVREFATWYMLRESCEDFVKGCGICNIDRKGGRPNREVNNSYFMLGIL